jgi:hypothetical protein
VQFVESVKEFLGARIATSEGQYLADDEIHAGDELGLVPYSRLMSTSGLPDVLFPGSLVPPDLSLRVGLSETASSRDPAVAVEAHDDEITQIVVRTVPVDVVDLDVFSGNATDAARVIRKKQNLIADLSSDTSPLGHR